MGISVLGSVLGENEGETHTNNKNFYEKFEYFLKNILTQRYVPQQLTNDLAFFVDQLGLLANFISWPTFKIMISVRNGTKNRTIAFSLGPVSYRMQKRSYSSFPWLRFVPDANTEPCKFSFVLYQKQNRTIAFLFSILAFANKKEILLSFLEFVRK